MVYVITAIGALGFVLMLAAFLVAAFRGWVRAMSPDASGRWPMARWLMLAGAGCGTLFGLLLLLPGVIPWWDYSSPSFNWILGALFAGAIAMLCWQFSRARRVGRA